MLVTEVSVKLPELPPAADCRTLSCEVPDSMCIIKHPVNPVQLDPNPTKAEYQLAEVKGNPVILIIPVDVPLLVNVILALAQIKVPIFT